MSQASDDEEDYMSDAFLLKWCVFLFIFLWSVKPYRINTVHVASETCLIMIFELEELGVQKNQRPTDYVLQNCQQPHYSINPLIKK